MTRQQGIVQKRAPLHEHAVPKFGGVRRRRTLYSALRATA